MPSTFTDNLHLEQQATGEDAGTWGANLNNNVIAILDSALGDTLSLPLTNADVTLTTTQSQNNFIDLSGTLTANVNIIFPAIGRTYTVRNGTTGAFSVTLKTTAPGGNTVVIPQGIETPVILNGTDAIARIPGAYQFIENRVISTPTPLLDFINLGAFKFIRITGRIVGSGVPGPLIMRVSSNNGISYDAGASDYATQVGTSTQSLSQPGGVNASFIQLSSSLGLSSFSFCSTITGFNQAANTAIESMGYGVDGSSRTFVCPAGGHRLSATADNAFRLQVAVGNITSADIFLEGVLS